MRKPRSSEVLDCADGSTVIEYAIVLPLLMLLVMGILEFNMIMYAMSVLDGATAAAARSGSTGYVNNNSTGTCPSPLVNGVVTPQTQSQYINCLVGVRVAGFLDPTKLQISYNDTGSSTFNSATDAPTAPSGPCTNNAALANPPSLPLCSENTQNAGDIVIYTVTYPWPVYTPFLQPFLGTSGIFTLSASAVVKNEPYNTSR